MFVFMIKCGRGSYLSVSIVSLDRSAFTYGKEHAFSLQHEEIHVLSGVSLCGVTTRAQCTGLERDSLGLRGYQRTRACTCTYE